MTVRRDKFDFEIGYLMKSPCKECLYRNNLPQCSDQCNILDKIRIILSKGISCSRHIPFIKF
ncbi:MAG: hypothetical protein ACKVE4_00510 [Dissulfuribacterales bacterium]